MGFRSSAICVMRKPWSLSFSAEPEEVAVLRRLVGLRLELWELVDLVEAAQLCVTELVSNVITHVGQGTPTTLTVAMRGPHLRIEVHDPATRVLPALIEADVDREGGRGMALVAATAVRLGVELLPDRKVTWCELATTESPLPWRRSPRFSRAEGLLDLYHAEEAQGIAAGRTGFGRLTLACAEEAAIDIIADLLHWFHVHGRDADDVLDRAQVYFEAELGPHPTQAHASL